MRLLRSLVPILLLLTAACLAPPVEGPQIDDAPKGFAFNPNCSVARSVLDQSIPVNQRCYVSDFLRDDPDWVTISEYDSVVTSFDAENAYRTYVDRWVKCYPDPGYCETAGELEPVTANGYAGWGFPITTTRESEQIKVSYFLIVPYEEATYTVVVTGRHGEHNDLAWARSTALRFSVRYTSDLEPIQIGVGLLAVLFGAALYSWLVHRQRVDARKKNAPLSVRVPPPGGESMARPVLDGATHRAGLLRQRFATDPHGVIAELDKLEREFMPHPQLMHLHALACIKLDQHARALEIVRQAWPLLLQRDQFPLAVDLFHHLGEHAFSLGIGRDQELRVAGALLDQGFWQIASQIYGRALQADPHDKKAASGLIRIAENRLKVAEGADEALQLYGFLKQACQDPVLLERIEQGLVRAGQPASSP